VLLVPAAEHNQDAIQFGLDCRCWSLAALAIVRWFLHEDEALALNLARSAVSTAEEINHIPTLGLTLMYQAFLHQYMQDSVGVADACRRLLDLSRRFSLPAIEAYAAIIDCWVHEDVTTLTQILNVLQAMGCQLGLTYLISLAADLMARAGDLPAALAEVDRCLIQAASTGERYYEAELLLQKANLLLKQHSPPFITQILPILMQAITCAKTSGMEFTRRRAASQLEALLAKWPEGEYIAGTGHTPRSIKSIYYL
jgi:predicted ATPase